jgi:hypothetical protein
MRPESAGPAVELLDLLARADTLAVAAIAAIGAGDDAALSVVVEDRGHLIDAVTRVCADLAARGPGAGTEAAAVLTAAMRQSHAAGVMACDAAVRSRDEIVSQLSALEARQQASQEYQPDLQRTSIDVTL